MNIKRHSIFTMALLVLVLTMVSTRLRADTGTCGGATTTLPFNDVMGNVFFCQIAEAFFSGLTNGTTPTTYSPTDPVPREQMAAFISRTMDQSLRRGSRRAALKKWWTPTGVNGLQLTTVGALPFSVEADGADLWVANLTDGTVSRVRGSDGKSLETWTGATGAVDVLSARGLIFVIGSSSPGKLYQIDPRQTAGAVTTLTTSVFLGNTPSGIAFDGARIWTSNASSVSIVTLTPFSVTTVPVGFSLQDIIFDGSNMWVTDNGDSTLKKLDSSGNIIQTVNVGTNPFSPVFDGTNIWVPNATSSTVTVVRASTGAVLATLTGNGLNGSASAAFDGERVAVVNQAGNSVSLWKAADLTPLGSVATGAGTFPAAICSDGINFWITFETTPGSLARF